MHISHFTTWNKAIRLEYVDKINNWAEGSANYVYDSELNLSAPVIFTISKDGVRVFNEGKASIEDATTMIPGVISDSRLQDDYPVGSTFSTPEWMQKDEEQILQVGSAEGSARSTAVYNSVVVEHADGTQTPIDNVSGVTGDGNIKFINKDVKVNFGNGDKIIADISWNGTINTDENILSVGDAIADWPSTGNGNIHLYWKNEGKLIEFDHVTSDYVRFNKTTDARHIKLTFSKEGVTFEKIVDAKDYDNTFFVPQPIKYDANMAGKKINFSNSQNGKVYIIDETNGTPLVKNITTTTDYTEKVTDPNTQAFIASNIVKSSNINKNEGPFMSYVDKIDTGTDKYKPKADLGVFVDRAINSAKLSQATWNITPADNGTNCKLSLTMPYDITTGEETADKQNKTYYLCATSNYVTGFDADGNPIYYESDPSGAGFTDDLSTAELVEESSKDATGRDDEWRIIPLYNYVQMLNNKPENFSELFDATFLLQDPDFTRENGELKAWKAEGEFTSDSDTDIKLAIGYDNYYKKSTADEKYTGENWQANNHGRYMDVAVSNSGSGEFYQEFKIYRRGWYVIKCQGKSNVGAKLFVQRGDNSNSRVSVELKKNLDVASLNAKDMKWPYTDYMPMYNAAVEMNDEHLTTSKIDEYANSVKYYISSTDVSLDNPMTLRVGISIPENSTTGMHTVFDSFRILYGGNTTPNLVLDENNTDLDYFDNCIHDYKNNTLFLHRTFNAGKWNTIVLPVDLTQEQFSQMFGDSTELAYLKEIKSNTMCFATVAETAEPFMKAYMPYLIKTAKASGTIPGFTQELTLRDAVNESQKIQQTVADGNFAVAGVALKHHQEETDHYYDFADGMLPTDVKSYAANDGKKYGVKATAEGKGVATNPDYNSYVLTSYGMLCKNYQTVDGKNTFIEGRDYLDDGNSYYLKNDAFTLRKQGARQGSKGLRAWFVYASNGSDVKPENIKLSFNGIDDNTESIGDIMQGDGEPAVAGRFAQGVYNMNGQKLASGVESLSSLPAGMYIVNGRKYIVR